MSNWEAYAFDDFFDDTYPFPICYAIFGDGQILYVGQSEVGTKRALQHGIYIRRYSTGIITPWGEFRDVTIKIRPSRKYGDWAMVELRLIRRLKPVGNKRGLGREARYA